MVMYNAYPKVIKAHCVEDPLERSVLNHVCCVCHASLNNRSFNPKLQTSHGYCEACLEVALSNIGGSHENN